MSDMSGTALFCRFAFPPNSLGYCGPSDPGLLKELVTGGETAREEVTHVIPAFAGAWPYLELIASCSGRDPLHPAVVEAYWLGNTLLEEVDLLTMGNSVDDRFRRRAGWDWQSVTDALNAGGRPTHSFHVFCIYPWVGLLQSGIVEQALDVLDRCRIRWGEVKGRGSVCLRGGSSRCCRPWMMVASRWGTWSPCIGTMSVRRSPPSSIRRCGDITTSILLSPTGPGRHWGRESRAEGRRWSVRVLTPILCGGQGG
jgi:hypothetical protein